MAEQTRLKITRIKMLSALSSLVGGSSSNTPSLRILSKAEVMKCDFSMSRLGSALTIDRSSQGNSEGPTICCAQLPGPKGKLVIIDGGQRLHKIKDDSKVFNAPYVEIRPVENLLAAFHLSLQRQVRLSARIN